MTANDIDISKINPAFKGCKVRVRPLHDINDMGRVKGYGLNIKMKDEKRYKPGKFAPFMFEDEVQAVIAAKIINDWSQSPSTVEQVK